MKSSMIISASVLALTVFAEPPTRAQRDVAAASSVIAEISSAITQLDTSVKAFESDATQMQKNADALVAALKSGASKIGAGGEISLTDALGLQDSVEAIGTASVTLMQDLESKKNKVEAAGLCSTTRTTVQNIGDTAGSLVASIIAKLPESTQDLAQSQTGQLTDTLSKGAAAFSTANCKDAAAKSIPVRRSTSATGTGVLPTGSGVASPSSSPSSSLLPVPTGAAAANGAGSVGVVAGLAAALLL